MMPTFYTSLTGLRANATAINVVSNNLANVNTSGFKRSDTNFAQLMTGQIQGRFGAGSPIQFGMGARTTRIGPTFQQGAVQSTGVNTNLALQGEGFFIASNGDRTAYTRAGNFFLNQQGTLVSSNGWNVLGFSETDADGNIIVGGTPSPLQVDFNEPSPPRATGTVRYVTNLSAEAEAGATFPTTIDVWDSEGGSHRLNLQLTKTENPGEWEYAFSLPNGEVLSTGDSAGSGTLTFDAEGRLSSVNGVGLNDAAIANPNITITGLPAGPNGTAPEDFNITWDLMEFGAGPNGGNDSYFTNFGGFSSNGTFVQDGFGSGDLNRIEFMRDGTMLGFFTNGETHPLGQVAIANFNNVSGLKQINGNYFEATGASGDPLVVEGNGGTVVFGGALESSNVDIAQEFTSLIVHQRGYQSNSKGITTADQVLQEIINLKR